MARKKHRRSGDYERFVALPHYMLRSPAWKTLPPDAKALLIEVWMRHNGMNNGEIAYSVREAQQIGLSRSVAARMFLILVERGFLEIRRNSTFTLKTKEARLWRLTMEPWNGKGGTKDFMRWSPNSVESDSQKFRTQSRYKDAQSHGRDPAPKNVIKLSASVPGQGPSRPNQDGSQSPRRDTYILPGGVRS